MTTRLWRTLKAISQTLNAVSGGHEDQTFSGRTALSARDGRRGAIIREAAINLLFALIAGERGHCEASIEWDRI